MVSFADHNQEYWMTRNTDDPNALIERPSPEIQQTIKPGITKTQMAVAAGIGFLVGWALTRR